MSILCGAALWPLWVPRIPVLRLAVSRSVSHCSPGARWAWPTALPGRGCPAGCPVFTWPFLVLGDSVLAWRPSRRRALRMGSGWAGAWAPGPGDLARRVGGGQPRGRGATRLALAAAWAGPAGASGAGDEAARLEDEAGDLFGGGAGDLGQDRGVGVGGEHDRGVAHHVLHHLQFHPCGQG